MRPYRWIWFRPEPEHCVSEETWNGGDGLIDFNYVQQSPPDVDHGELPDLTTDIWGISDGAYYGSSAS